MIKVGTSVKRRKNGVGYTGPFDEELCSHFWTVWGSWPTTAMVRLGEGQGVPKQRINNFAKNSPIFPRMTSTSS